MNEKIYDEFLHEMVEMPLDMKSFLEEIETVCRKHNFSFSHEDEQGCFYVETFKESNMQWLLNASKNYTRDMAPGTNIPLAPNYVGEGCQARGEACQPCKYRNYCFSAWNQPAQEKLLGIISNSQ